MRRSLSESILFRWSAGLALMLALAAAISYAQAPAKATTDSQEPGATPVDRKILAEAKKNPDTMNNLTYLSDVIGPRLTGSAAAEKANKWAAERMKAYGLENVHLEPWTIPQGWERGTVHARLIEPDNGRTLSMASYAWMGGTKGKIQGDVVILKAATVEELQKYAGKLKNAIVLQGAPTQLRPLADMDKGMMFGGGPGGGKGKGKGKKDGDGQDFQKKFAQMRAQRKAMQDFMQQEGVAATLSDAGKHFGLLFTTGSWQGSDRPSATNRVPQLAVAHNHYELLYRLASRPGPAKTRLELEVTNKFIDGPIKVYNTVGEVRGSEKPNEVVVCGAHIDSWDLGQGTTDNGTGTCTVLETARILAKLAKEGSPPKRTIRFILFTGEEQGLLGSQAYVKQHQDELKNISAAIVHDTGTGKVIGIATGRRPKAKEVLEKELGWLKELGVTDFSRFAGGGSDHMSFEGADVPGFMFNQEVAGYGFTHHSQADTLDRAIAENLEQGASVMAVLATHIANLPDLLPRDAAPGIKGKKKFGGGGN
jgi:hypothetical protein